MTIYTQARGQAPGVLGRLFSLFTGITLPFRRRKSLRVLEELDDHLLNDIGITRCQIRDMRRHW